MDNKNPKIYRVPEDPRVLQYRLKAESLERALEVAKVIPIANSDDFLKFAQAIFDYLPSVDRQAVTPL